MALIELERVRYRYPTAGAWALDDISLGIEAGEYVVLAGASGSGKSSLLRMLNGLIPHFYEGELQGHVRIASVDTRDRPVHEWLPYVGLVFQNPRAQLFASSVERELAFAPESLGLEREEIRRRIQWAADKMGIVHLLDKVPSSLSGGEQQRVALASVLVTNPRILALDEPFAYLDPEAASNLRTILRDLVREGLTLVVAEHRLSDIVAEATRLVVMSAGRIVIDEAPQSALRHDLRRFDLNMPPLAQLGRRRDLAGVPLKVDQAIDVRISPPQARSPVAPSFEDADIVAEGQELGFDLENRPILRGLNFRVRRGEILALVGRNGSGKTTLLKLMNGLYKPQRGRMTVLGRDTRRARIADLAPHIGLVFQNPNDQLFKLSVREEIAAGPRALGRYDAAVIDALAIRLSLSGLMDRSPFRLSEGQKKRVTFASAVAAQPEIVLLDEPTVGQDVSARDALVDWLANREHTAVLATHDLEFAHTVASRWIVLADGEIIADGTLEQVMANESVMRRAGLLPTPLLELGSMVLQQEISI